MSVPSYKKERMTRVKAREVDGFRTSKILILRRKEYPSIITVAILWVMG
jgi:hypothetical protein